MNNSPSSSDLADDNSRRTANINTDDIHFSTSHVFGNKQTSPTENGQIPQERITGTLFFAVFTAVIGTAFQFGYASGVINAPQEIIKQFINETIHKRNSQTTTSDSQLTLIFSFIVSIFCLGGMIGGLFGGFITDRLGRKGGMYVNNIISMVACLFMFLSKVTSTYELLFVGRFFIGLSCGYGSSVAPTYISEVSPKNLRGTLGAAFQLGVVISVLMSQIMSLSTVVGSATTWHIGLSLPIIFSVIQIILLFFVPESPKYLLVKRNDEAGAEKGLRWLRKHSEVHHEITEMQDEKNQQQQAVSIADLFRTPLVRWALLITVVLQLSQQLSGINAVFYYSTTIFKSAHYSDTTSENINIGLGATNIVVTILSSFLMDRLGRRILHMTGLGGMLVTVIILIISLLVKSTPALISVITIVFFVAFFGIGPGSIPWLITAELFNQAYRVPASSIAVLVNWSANFLVAIGFNPLFTQVLGVPTFFIFVGLLLAFLLFTFFFVPETKAKNVETIYAEINAGQVWRTRRGQLLHGDNRSGQINDYGSTVDYGVLPAE